MQRSWGTRLVSLLAAAALGISLPLGALAESVEVYLDYGNVEVWTETEDVTGQDEPEEEPAEGEEPEETPAQEPEEPAEEPEEEPVEEPAEEPVEKPEEPAEEEEPDEEEPEQEDEPAAQSVVEKVVKTFVKYFNQDNTSTAITKELKDGDTLTVTQTNKETPVSNTITIKTAADTTVEVTIKDINIDTDGAEGDGNGVSAIVVEADQGSQVILELDGDNVVKGSGYVPAVEKSSKIVEQKSDANGKMVNVTQDNKGDLVIQDEKNDGGKATLKAIGGHGSRIGGVGIGGRYYANGENITIKSGNITAIGGDYAAGIGAGYYGDGVGIRITGGTVNATGGYGSAGIGGGICGNGKNIEISGGEVTATSGFGVFGVYLSGAAGIGGGMMAMSGGNTYGGDGENITISGGEVTAKGSFMAAGIGGGMGGDANNITVSGGTVYAEGGNVADIAKWVDTLDESGDGEVSKAEYQNTYLPLYAKLYKGLGAAGIGGGMANYNLKDVSGSVGEQVTYVGGNSDGIVISGGEVTAVSGGVYAPSIGSGPAGAVKDVIQVLNKAKVYLDTRTADESGNATANTDTGYIGTGYSITSKSVSDLQQGELKVSETAPLAGTYEVDCTATIAAVSEKATAHNVETAYRESLASKLWNWSTEGIGKYIHFAPSADNSVTEADLANGGTSFTNGGLTINCHGHQDTDTPVTPDGTPIDQTNTGVISSTDPIAAQRWYWVTALLDADENVGYTYEQIGSNLIVNADEAAQAAVLHVLLSGWAEHTEVQSITFVTAGKTTTLYAGDMLGITTGEQLTLTHEYEKATLAVDGRDYTYLLDEAAA